MQIPCGILYSTVQLHYDNLKALAEQDDTYGGVLSQYIVLDTLIHYLQDQ